MPWKGIKDPYKIWLSEIILQQTRVEQGLAYYLAFISKYPTIFDLAAAKDDNVFKLWQGLGYYNRCKNLLFTARYIVTELEGKFPNTYDEILKLKGIGTYTAAAIASFAFGESKAVVDGNVVRVLSRHFGLKFDFNTGQGKKNFIEYADSLISKKEPALFNQAIMDLGATICKPTNPDCGICPLQKSCFALENGEIHAFPLKKKALALKKRYLHFLVFEDKRNILLQQRSDNDIWANLYDFFSIESESVSHFEDNELMNPQRFEQKLSHQHINASFYILPQKNLTKIAKKLNLLKVKKTEIIHYSFPRVIVSFLEKNKYL